MQVMEERRSNYLWKPSAKDPDGNAHPLCSIGLVKIRTDGEDLSDLLATRYLAERVCDYFIGPRGPVGEDREEETVSKILSELGLGFVHLSNRLATSSSGKTVKSEICAALSRYQLDPRLQPSWKELPRLASRLKQFISGFQKKELPPYLESMTRRAQPIARDLKARLEKRLEEIHQTQGLVSTIKIMERLRERIEHEGKGLAGQTDKFEGSKRESNLRVLDQVARIERASTWVFRLFNLFRQDAILGMKDETFSALESALLAEVTISCLAQVKRVYEGLSTPQGGLDEEGLIRFLEKGKQGTEAELGAWQKRQQEFMGQYRRRLGRTATSRRSFEFVVPLAKGNHDIEALYQERLSQAGIWQESLLRIERLLSLAPSEPEINVRLLDEGKQVFRSVFQGESLEERILEEPEFFRKLADQVRCAGVYLPIKAEVNRRMEINPEDNQFLIVTVADKERSLLKEKMIQEMGLKDDDFVSSGNTHEMIIVTELYGEPTYALGTIEALRSRYRAVLKSPLERSVSCVPNPERLLDIKEPEKSMEELILDCFVMALALGQMRWNEGNESYEYVAPPGGDSERRLSSEEVQVLGSYDLALARIRKDSELRTKVMQVAFEKACGQSATKEALLKYYRRPVLSFKQADLHRRIISRLLWKHFQTRVPKKPRSKSD